MKATAAQDGAEEGAEEAAVPGRGSQQHNFSAEYENKQSGGCDSEQRCLDDSLEPPASAAMMCDRPSH